VNVVATDSLDRWDQYVRSRPDANVGLRPEWRGVLEGTYGLRAHYLEAVEHGRCVGVLPLYEQRTILGRKVLISIPYCSYGGLLADTNEGGAALIAMAEELGRRMGARYIELKQLEPSGQGLETRTENTTVLCRLDGDEHEHLMQLRKKTRERVRQCLREEGLTIRLGPQCLPGFFSLYVRRVHEMGVPSHAFALFASAQSAFGDDMWVALVEWQGQPVAAGVYLVWHGTCASIWTTGMRRAGRSAPGYRLYWGVMQHARQHGLDCFRMGRSQKGSTLLDFKRQWGGEVVDLPYEYVALRGRIPDGAQVITRGQRLAMSVWRALPAPLARALGPYACRRIPVW
jgi:FemAB-related protein (PEP-CTERM system-associated)